MTKLIRLLAVIAVVQVLFMIMTWTSDTKLDTQADSNTLLSFNSTEINRIVISSSAENTENTENDAKKPQTVTLSKQAGKWQTADTFPANEGKVTALLDKLKGLKYSLPIATSQQALTRFKVTNDDFERLIELQKDDKTVAKLYLGTGAGARQTHARRDDQAAVYSVALGAYDAPAKRSDWQNKTVLHLEKDTITKVELADLSLQPDSTTQATKATLTLWKADKLPEDKLLNQKGIHDSLPALFTLSFNQVLGKENKPEYGLDKPVLDITLHDKTTQYHYQLGQLKDSKDYVLKRSDRAEYFQLAEFVAKPLVENISKEKWLLDKAKPVEEKPKPATEAAKAEPVAAEPVKAESVAVGPVKTEPVAVGPVKTEPVAVEPVKVEPAVAEPVKVEPAVTEPVKVAPAVTEPVKVEPAVTEPVKMEPAVTEPVKVEPAIAEPAKVEPAIAEPVK